ncbi:putative Carboxypeptidase E [Hypsibius exemplaris]|uniref:Carboxypeptidase E n=1 Tax=Hypsibius exemplaris TaxID=2072580 RepID=A0A9X6NMN2_HYPEX|nr:putative Carboxypeptidase E [Hypsibius exemplaris]
MFEGHPCPRYNQDEFFRDGITNGAKWYPVAGGMQDWNYLNSNTFEITVELGCWKYPNPEYLQQFWQVNKRPLIAYLMEVHKGVHGFVRDDQNRPIANATIRVEGINHNVVSNADGDYWRLLAPGDYRITALKKGYTVARRKVTVVKDAPATVVNFQLASQQPEDNSAVREDGNAPQQFDEASREPVTVSIEDEFREFPHQQLVVPSVIPPLAPTTKRHTAPTGPSSEVAMRGGAPSQGASVGLSAFIILLLICEFYLGF